ncbi:hypothetical protein [Rice Mononega-like virus]|nr:hypothetical protein [Rice Mononega-like virus]
MIINMKLFTFICLSLVLLRSILSMDLECFDCMTGSGNVSLIDAYETEECQNQPVEKPTEKVTIQIVQKDSVRELILYACKIEHRRSYYRCSWLSDLQLIPNSVNIEYIDIGFQACKEIIDNGKLRLNEIKISDLKLGKTKIFSTNDIGTVKEGSCSGVDVLINGIKYSKVVSTDVYTISTKLITIKYSLTNNIFELNGDYYRVDKGSDFNTQVGYFYWSPLNVGRCEDKGYKLLYNGLAEKFTLTSTYAWMINNTERAFALESDRQGVECGRNVFYLKNKDIMLLEYNNDNLLNKFDGMVDDLNDVDLTVDLHSKIVYLDQHIAKQMSILSKFLEMSFCEIRQQYLSRLLQSVKYDAETFAYNLYKERGYLAESRGNLIHVTRCTKSLCKLRESARCYQDIPVTYKNMSKFIHPLTRNLKDHSEEYLCSPLAVTTYFVDGEWVRTTPYLEIIPIHPIKLNPNKNLTWLYSRVEHHNRKGIYTDDQISNYRKYLVTRTSEKAIRNNLARGMLGLSVSTADLRLDRVIDDKLIHTTWVRVGDWIWQKFTSLGIFTSGILGLWLLGQLILKCIEIFINCMVIYKQHGLNIRMLASVSNIATRLTTATGDNKISVFSWRRRRNAPTGLDEVVSSAPLDETVNLTPYQQLTREMYKQDSLIPKGNERTNIS